MKIKGVEYDRHGEYTSLKKAQLEITPGYLWTIKHTTYGTYIVYKAMA